MKLSIQPVLAAILLASCGTRAFAQAVDVDVSVNVKHTVEGISTFDREKFSTIHAVNFSGEWGTQAQMDGFVVDRDVYFGRDTGYIGWTTRDLIDENPAKQGWTKVSGTYSLEHWGNYWRGQYNNKPHEARGQSGVACAQFTPYWPGSATNNNSGGSGIPWVFSTADTPDEPFGSAVGFHLGHFMNEFFGTAANSYIGPPQPEFFEIINEPDYPLFTDTDDPMYGDATEAELFEYHNTVADQIRSLNSDVLIGGYCNAFPDLENNDFQEWQDEWMQFIDICGTNMDFYSIHTYDVYDEGKVRKGSNLEATLDLIEHYSNIRVGTPLPFVVSEYGGRDKDLEGYWWRPTLWVPERDWVAIKSINSMLMSFADRPHLIYKTIPFIMLKEEWHYNYNGFPHSWRLYKKANEPASYTGDWVYTDYIKFYDLWKDVNGTRVDIITSDPDIQVDAYVDGDKAYVILNNLDTTINTVNLNLFEYHGNTVQSVREKNLYWNGTNTTLDETVHAGNMAQVQVEAEGAVILEYTFASAVNVNETLDEVKYYASTYFQPITQESTKVFNIDGVSKGIYGEAILRLGMGREHARSKKPVVVVNEFPVTVPEDFMGHEGDSRERFFGELDIPVPYWLLQSNNTISVTYPDSGGYISSVSLRTFEFSSDFRGNGWAPEGSIITSAEVAGSDFVLSISNGVPSGYFDLITADDLLLPGSNWIPSQAGLQFNDAGESTLTNPIAENQGFFRVRETPVQTILVAGVSVSPASRIVSVGQTIQLAATVSPSNASNQSVTWSSGAPAVASVDASGLVTALQVGSSIVTAATSDGGFTDTSVITVGTNTPATFDFNIGASDWEGNVDSPSTSGLYNFNNDQVVPSGNKYIMQLEGGGDGYLMMFHGGADDGPHMIESIFTVQDAANVDQTFSVNSLNWYNPMDGVNTTTIIGYLGGVGGTEVWTLTGISALAGPAITTATTGAFSDTIDTIHWKTVGATYQDGIFGSSLDNLSINVIVTP